jgi:hypothetical protein
MKSRFDPGDSGDCWRSALSNNIIKSRFGVFLQRIFYNICNYLFTLELFSGIIGTRNIRRFGVL